MFASVSDVAIFIVMVVLAVVFFALEVHAVRTESRVRRWAAIVPAMVVGWIVLGILWSPEAHSLWPLEIVLWLIPAILALLLLRISSGRASTDLG